jgi:hypothetical protein
VDRWRHDHRTDAPRNLRQGVAAGLAAARSTATSVPRARERETLDSRGSRTAGENPFRTPILPLRRARTPVAAVRAAVPSW